MLQVWLRQGLETNPATHGDRDNNQFLQIRKDGEPMVMDKRKCLSRKVESRLICGVNMMAWISSGRRARAAGPSATVEKLL